MSTNEVSSKILSNTSIISSIYAIIKEAGLEATNDRGVRSERSNVCVIKANQPGTTRMSGCTPSNNYSIEYDSNDLTIVGGAALNLYDSKLNEFKERHRIGALEGFIKKMTSDIDIVWWPRSISGKDVSNIIITSQSVAIQILAAIFVEILNRKFYENLPRLSEIIKGLTDFEIYSFETRPAGVININVNFIINGTQIKMCDIIVHDSGASQRYDITGKEITTLLPMQQDVIYMNPMPGQLNSITYLNINGIYIAVPNILQFVKQQILAFSNLVRVQHPKSLINYKRIQYIRFLLSNFTSNVNNIRNLSELFSTNNIEYPMRIVREIDKLVDESLIINKQDINNLCLDLKIPKDEITTHLCSRTIDLSKTGILEVYSPAPAYPPPPPPIQSFYYESKSNRRIKWLQNAQGRGQWFYLDPPPLPPGPPPNSLLGKPPLFPRSKGGIRRNKTLKKVRFV
jgi:hypothetical protein